MIRDTIRSRWFWALLMVALIVVFLAYQWTSPYSLDIGAIRADDDLFIAGFHQRESSPNDDYRWTGPRALVSFPGLGRGRPWTLSTHLSGYRPSGRPSPQVSLSVNGHRVEHFVAHDGMTKYQFPIDASLIGWSGSLLVEIAPDVFTPESDARQLGVLVSRITVTPAGPGLVVPPPITLLLVAGSTVILFLFLRWMGAPTALSFWIGLLPTAVLGFVIALHRQYVTSYALGILLLVTTAAISSVALHTVLQQAARRLRWQALANMNTRALLGILLLALACNVALLPTPGFVGDMGIFMRWSWKLTTGGLHTAYLHLAPVEPIDYPPLIPYILSVMGALYQRLCHASFPYPPERTTLLFYSVMKLPSVAADIGTGVIIFFFVRRRASQRLALLSMAAYVFNPAILFASAYGGQTDAIHSFFAVLAVVLILGRRVIGGWASIALASLSKPQGAFFLPLILFLTWKRLGVRSVLKGVAAATIVGFLVFLPFLYGGTGDSLAEYLFSVGRLDIPGMPAYTTLGAHNLWWLFAAGAEVADIGESWSHMPFSGTLLTPRVLGLALVAILYLLGVVALWRRDDDLMVPVVAAFVNFACFMTLTQVHARYVFSTLPFLAMALTTATRWRTIYVVLSITFLTNMVLHDAALLDMFGLLEHEGLLDPIKYINALVNVGVLIYWAVVLSAGRRSGLVAGRSTHQEEGAA